MPQFQPAVVTIHVEDIGLPAVLCDTGGRLLAVNGQARGLLNLADQGSSLFDLAVSIEGGKRLEAAWQEKAGQGHGWTHECQLQGKLGAALEMQLVAMSVLSGPASQHCWLVIVQDLTGTVMHAKELEIYAQELSQLYRENKQHIQKLEEAARSREHFFSLVSHELKTPLTSQKAAMEMLNNPGMIPADATGALKLVSTMTRSTARLERLISDLLDVAVAFSGGLSLRFDPVDMTYTIHSVMDEMRPLAREKDITLNGPKRRKPLIVRGDEIRLQQVVQNLLSNAIKAAPQGSAIQIATSARDKQARVTVTNPGSIPEDLRPTIFEPFRKSPAGGYRTGAGLGLTVVDALVKAHGGDVELEPDRKMVSFTFSIPLYEGAR